jgi:MOSC domain-containing protein
VLRLSAINRFPVKSCRGEALQSAQVEPWGLAGDRRWMLVDDEGDVITARERPRLLLATPRWAADGGLDLSSPDNPDLHVPMPDGSADEVRVHGNPVRAVAATDEAHAWFSKITGVPSRLVYLADPTGRRPNPRFAEPDDRVSFADAYPLLLATTASLDALCELIGERLPMIRFRPNVVVDGSTPWAEDGWRRLRIGEAVFRAVKGCDRCVMTLIDPDTAEKGREPIRTLARHRRWDGKTWFAMNLIPDTAGATIEVGAEVEILEAVDASDGPPR